MYKKIQEGEVHAKYKVTAELLVWFKAKLHLSSLHARGKANSQVREEGKASREKQRTSSPFPSSVALHFSRREQRPREQKSRESERIDDALTTDGNK